MPTLSTDPHTLRNQVTTFLGPAEELTPQQKAIIIEEVVYRLGRNDTHLRRGDPSIAERVRRYWEL